MTTVYPADLAAAVAALPNRLAADVTAWVRAAETRGTQFPTALAAVTAALAAIHNAEVKS
jgi:hypothetical protein